MAKLCVNKSFKKHITKIRALESLTTRRSVCNKPLHYSSQKTGWRTSTSLSMSKLTCLMVRVGRKVVVLIIRLTKRDVLSFRECAVF